MSRYTRGRFAEDLDIAGTSFAILSPLRIDVIAEFEVPIINPSDTNPIPIIWTEVSVDYFSTKAICMAKKDGG